jgi:hypothetical protein
MGNLENKELFGEHYGNPEHNMELWNEACEPENEKTHGEQL